MHFFSPEADPNVHAGDDEGDDSAEDVEEDARQGGVLEHEEAKDVKEDHLNIYSTPVIIVMIEHLHAGNHLRCETSIQMLAGKVGDETQDVETRSLHSAFTHLCRDPP